VEFVCLVLDLLDRVSMTGCLNFLLENVEPFLHHALVTSEASVGLNNAKNNATVELKPLDFTGRKAT